MSFSELIITLLPRVATSNGNTFNDGKAAVLTYLQNKTINSIIRIYVPNSPNFGHQATTVNIMWRLIALGFNQSMEVVYDNGGQYPMDPSTIQKLALLIPGLNPNNPQPVTIDGVVISFIEQQTFTSQNLPKTLTFGITGGYDSDDDNLGKKFFTKSFLKLQPYGWSRFLSKAKPPKWSHPSVLYNIDVSVDLNNVDVFQDTFNKFNYYMPIPQMSALDYDNFNNKDCLKATIYKYIIQDIDNHLINLMPIYGIADKNGQITAQCGGKPESVLFNLIAGVASAQKSHIRSLEKGTVLVNIANVTSQPYRNLRTMLNGETTGMPQLNEYASNNELKARVKIVNYNDSNFYTYMQEVENNPDKILLVNINGLPQYAFNYMYYRSTLPCVFEGKGTAGMILNLGLPYLHFNQNSQVYPTLPLTSKLSNADAIYCDEVASSLLNDFSTTQNLIRDGFFYKSSINKTGNFIEANATANHPLRAYFAQLGTFFHNEENDKLLNALGSMLSII